MAVLPIITGQDAPILHQKTQEISKVTKDIIKLIRDMEQTVKAADGLGLAAPQIDKNMRICLVKLHGRFIPLINPVITQKSRQTDIAEEGCLSLPEIWLEIERPVGIVVSYMDAKGKQQERRLKNLNARVIQHEIDHLDGILITDYQQKVKPM